MTKASIRSRRATPPDIDTVIAFNGAMAEETEDKKLDPNTLSAGVRQALTDENRCVYLVAEISAARFSDYNDLRPVADTDVALASLPPWQASVRRPVARANMTGRRESARMTAAPPVVACFGAD